MAALVSASLLGCGRYAVRATEKEYLADRVMAFDDREQEARAEDSLLDSREGSTGSRSNRGGGSGCK